MTKFSVIYGSTFNRDVPLISQAFSEPYKLRQKNYMEIDGDSETRWCSTYAMLVC